MENSRASRSDNISREAAVECRIVAAIVSTAAEMSAQCAATIYIKVVCYSVTMIPMVKLEHHDASVFLEC